MGKRNRDIGLMFKNQQINLPKLSANHWGKKKKKKEINAYNFWVKKKKKKKRKKEIKKQEREK